MERRQRFWRLPQTKLRRIFSSSCLVRPVIYHLFHQMRSRTDGGGNVFRIRFTSDICYKPSNTTEAPPTQPFVETLKGPLLILLKHTETEAGRPLLASSPGLWRDIYLSRSPFITSISKGQAGACGALAGVGAPPPLLNTCFSGGTWGYRSITHEFTW